MGGVDSVLVAYVEGTSAGGRERKLAGKDIVGELVGGKKSGV